MTVFISMLAALAAGNFTGCLLMAIYTHARVSRSQERMQKIVRYWQADAKRWREEVDRLSRRWPGVAQPPLDTRGG
jgi:hypothetical protein